FEKDLRGLPPSGTSRRSVACIMNIPVVQIQAIYACFCAVRNEPHNLPQIIGGKAAGGIYIYDLNVSPYAPVGRQELEYTLLTASVGIEHVQAVHDDIFNRNPRAIVSESFHKDREFNFKSIEI